MWRLVARREPLRTITQLWPFIRPDRRLLFFAAAPTLALTVMHVGGVLLVRSLVDSALDGARGEVTTFPTRHQVILLTLLVVTAAARGLMITQQTALAGLIGERVAARIRSALWAHVLVLPLASVQRRGAGRLLVRFLADARSVQRLVTRGLVRAPQDLILTSAILLTMAWLSPLMALVAALTLPAYAAIFLRENPNLRQASRAVRRRRTRLAAYIHERVGGLAVVKVSLREKREAARIERMTRSLAKRGARLAAAAGRLGGMADGAAGVAHALVLAVGANEAANGRISAGTLLAFSTLFYLLLPIFRRLTTANRAFQEASISVERLISTLAEPAENAGGRRRLSITKGLLAVEHLSFGYEDGRPILRDVSLTARRGELVALTGANGEGKSTMLDLLLRFRQPESGRVLIDGQDIAKVALKSLRREIGVVPREAPLFDGTVAENIAYGLRRRAVAAEIAAAAKLAGIDENSSGRLADGLATPVGEGGKALSAGQRQQVALARALIADPPILVLDEADAALDVGAERHLVGVLKGLARQKTVIVATHRPAMLEAADRVYVLERGRIAGNGSDAHAGRSRLMPPERPQSQPVPAPPATKSDGARRSQPIRVFGLNSWLIEENGPGSSDPWHSH